MIITLELDPDNWERVITATYTKKWSSTDRVICEREFPNSVIDPTTAVKMLLERVGQ